MAYDRFGRENTGNYGRDDRDEFTYSSARDYRAAGELGGYGRDSQREYGQRESGQRDYGQRDYGQGGYGRQQGGRQDYGQRDSGRSDYQQGGYGQRDYGNQRHGQSERMNRVGEYGSWGDDDRQGFTGGSDYYRSNDDDRQRQGRDTYRQSRGTYQRQPQKHDADEGRGFMARAEDEVRSWFGDEEAERRREMDARENERSGGRGNYGRDEHYRSWRNQQIAAFDRDYDEYRQENQSKFHNEFSSFRTERQGQRDLLNKVDEHMEVVGSDGSHVGTVDKVRGDRIILTKSDPDAGGRHHSIPSRWLQSVDDGKLKLRKTAEEAKQHWRDEERQQDGGRAMFGGERGQSSEGTLGRSNETGENTQGTNLNRSFSGTY